jgi:hypothetical protein
MTNKSSTKTIDNAEELIERFGGIRPMASKIDVAVTTVQGWKKRNSIPANRTDAILSAAQEHDIDVSDLVEIETPANENVSTPVVDDVPAAQGPEPQEAPENDVREDFTRSEVQHIEGENFEAFMRGEYTHSVSSSASGEDAHPSSVIAAMMHDNMVDMVKRAERRAVMNSTLITIILIGLTLGAFVLVLSPETKVPAELVVSEEQRQETMRQIDRLQTEVQQLQSDVDYVAEEQSFLGKVIPDNLQDRLSGLQEQAEQVRREAQMALDQAKSISAEVMNSDAEALRARVQAIEEKLGSLSSGPMMQNLAQRYNAYVASSGGQDLLEKSTDQLYQVLQQVNSEDPEVVDAALADARDQSAVLSQSLENVPQEDLKAAALLLSMAQMRNMLNRENQPFEEDLSVLMNLVGSDNAELTESLQRLSPHANQGVLTPQGLSDELRSLTGEIVVASLKGEDVSVMDKAKARLNTVLQVEKDGELLTGTETQSKVNTAETLMEQGDIAGAIAAMQTLDGDAAQMAGPWIEKAKAALSAQRVKNTLTQVLTAQAAGVSAYTAQGGASAAGSEYYVDPVSGMTVFKPAGGSAFKPSKSLNIQ